MKRFDWGLEGRFFVGVRIFRFWVSEERRENRGRETVEGRVFGGSNVSEADAVADLERRWRGVCERVFDGKPRDADTYDADIREEIVEMLDENTVVTRNRYGAEILNCTSPVIVDVDHVEPSFFQRLFGKGGDEATRIDRIVKNVTKLVEEGKFGIQGARMYRTPAGVRVILATNKTAPRSKEVGRMMRALHADGLYASLCRKQNCYRARLTAKPHRIGVKSLRQSWPVDEAQMAEREEWVRGYRAAADGYAACAFLTSTGVVPSSKALDLHDRWSGALSGKPLG